MTTLYMASKVKHAPRWRTLRDYLKTCGVQIIATWIDEDGEGQTKDRAELAERCIREAVAADYFILYAEEGEVLKGALIELGARLAAGKLCWHVGKGVNWPSGVFPEHRLCREAESMGTALAVIESARKVSPAPPPSDRDAAAPLAIPDNDGATGDVRVFHHPYKTWVFGRTSNAEYWSGKSYIAPSRWTPEDLEKRYGVLWLSPADATAWLAAHPLPPGVK